MLERLALDPSFYPDERTAKPAPRLGLGAMFKAAMEALVAAHARQADAAGPLLYRYPPI